MLVFTGSLKGIAASGAAEDGGSGYQEPTQADEGSPAVEDDAEL